MTFHIAYEVRDPANQRDPERIFVADFDSAIVSYNPDASLTVEIDGRSTELDVKRDMYGLYEDLPRVAERIAFEEPSAGPYLEAVGSEAPRTYSVRLDESYRPRIVYFEVDSEDVGIETRSASGGEVELAEDDVHPAVPSTRSAVVGEIVSFLDRYTSDLVTHLPEAAETAEYPAYRDRLDKLREAM